MGLDYERLLLESFKSSCHVKMEGANLNYANLLSDNIGGSSNARLYNTFNTDEQIFRKEWFELIKFKEGGSSINNRLWAR